MANNDDLFKNLISHCKEYGFIFPSSEIYDGLSAVYDYGHPAAASLVDVFTFFADPDGSRSNCTSGDAHPAG